MKNHTTTQKQSTREWHLIDAKDQILGRICSIIANLLRGKMKPNFVYHQDVGDYVVVTNAAKVRLSGRKADQKRYYRHSGYIGGLKTETFAQLRVRHPEEIIYQAVAGMLPKNRLRQVWLRRLRVFPAENHAHHAQKVIEIKIK